MTAADSPIVMLYEISGLYDGWSVSEHEDGTFRNRWADGDGPALGYARRWAATEAFIKTLKEQQRSGVAGTAA